MLDFVKSAFRSFFEVILWVNLILCTIFGSIAGGMINSSFGVLGFLIGIVIGLFTNIVGGGLIATILNMDNNLEQLVNTMKSGSSSSTESFRTSTLILNNKKCPFCAEEIKAEAKICPHCGKNIYEYELELKTQEEENRKKKEAEVNEKHGNLDALFKDDNIMNEAKKIRRIYGKSVYVSHLKNKAIELGLGEIEINENDID